MDLFTALGTLPLAPLRGLLALARVIQSEVDRQLYDPGTARRQIEELDAAAQSGSMSAEDRQKAEQEIVGRLVTPAGPAPADSDGDSSGNGDSNGDGDGDGDEENSGAGAEAHSAGGREKHSADGEGERA